MNFTNKDSISNVFEVQDEAFRTIKKNREVFGWHPYWMGLSWKKYPFELLSTISYFSYNVNSRTGLSQNPKQIEDWKNTKLIDKIRQESLPYSNFNFIKNFFIIVQHYLYHNQPK